MNEQEVFITQELLLKLGWTKETQTARFILFGKKDLLKKN